MDDDGYFTMDVANSEAIIYQIGISDSININVPGGICLTAELMPAGGKGKLIADFEAYINALDSGDHSLISDAITNIDENLNHVLRIRADIGARYNRLELTADRLDIDSINFRKLMSENEDVDQAENILLLKTEENVYRHHCPVEQE